MILVGFVIFQISEVDAQTKSKKVTKRPAAQTVPATEKSSTVPSETSQTTSETPQTKDTTPQKRNERKTTANGISAEAPPRTPEIFNLTGYVYEFSQPAFYLNKIVIKHDQTGNGTITFVRSDSDEAITDPVSISHKTIDQLNTLFDELDFLNSTESYQYSKDYSHLGNVKISLSRGDKVRSTTFNWTENSSAKELAGVYRKISNQYVWVFDIKLARENQSLETPKIMERLDGFLKRNEISDPPQLLPFLTDLSTDERLPLMARNRAVRLIEQIKKKANM